MRVHRLISILVLIEKNGKVKAKYLSDLLEVSTRTIYRDIDILSESGFPLYTTTGPEGGISFTEGYSLSISKDTIERKDILSLIISNLAVVPNNAQTANSIQAGFKKLQEQLNDHSKNLSPMEERILIDEETWWGESKDPFDIHHLMDALWHLRQITIEYQKESGPSSIRTLNPYGLVLKDTNWYLIAYCHKAQAIRTFRCERIIEVDMLMDTYTIPGTFHLKNHWLESIKAFTNTIIDSGDYLVSFQIPVAMIEHLPLQDVAWNHRQSGTMIGTVNLNHFSQAKSILTPLLSYVTLLSPCEMVEYSLEYLNEQIKKYV